ncbi:MAG: Smr/MutS family protein [Gammaproteobacteria bacterium]|nr:Smr/MutS family protein [Gammaproteobacteria bacterium]
MGRKRDINAEDQALFRDHVGKVRRIHAPPPVSAARRPAPIPLQTLADERQVMHEIGSTEFDPAELETGEELLYRAPGLQDRQFRRLRRGQFRVEAELDLHGFTADAARLALAGFLTRSRQEGKRCVRIIHGKGRRSHQGRPVLKTRVHHWLRQRRDVLGFCSALPPDGGTGAVYVLLKRGD